MSEEVTLTVSRDCLEWLFVDLYDQYVDPDGQWESDEAKRLYNELAVALS